MWIIHGGMGRKFQTIPFHEFFSYTPILPLKQFCDICTSALFVCKICVQSAVCVQATQGKVTSFNIVEFPCFLFTNKYRFSKIYRSTQIECLKYQLYIEMYNNVQCISHKLVYFFRCTIILCFSKCMGLTVFKLTVTECIIYPSFQLR